VENFDRLRPYLAGGAVVVVDDILMSDEMRRAWETIQGRHALDLALTLRRVGIVVVSE
jgi:hypothetical protein